jgi:hypothetical protein
VEIIGGFTFTEDPACGADRAVIAWTAVQNRAVIALDAQHSNNSNAFDFRKYRGRTAVIVDNSGKEHIVLSDGSSQIVADIDSGSVLVGPVSLKLIVPDHALVGMHLGQLQKLISALAHPDGLIPAHRNRNAAHKLVTALQVADALAAGASQRDIAVALFGTRRVCSDWNTASDALRSQVRRLIKRARQLSAGGWRNISR